jgi:nucleotide sugar dehydrogenase
MENTYRAANIALIDEWGVFAENVGIDIFEIIEAIRDRPTHSNMRQPGFGVGGYCLTKDPYFGQIANDAFFKSEQIKFPFANMAMEINQKMPLRNLSRILELVNKKPEKITMLMLGVTYRSEVGDTRHSASEIFYRAARELGIEVLVHDPFVKHWHELDKEIFSILPSPQGVDILVFAVPHNFYANIQFDVWLDGWCGVVYDCDKVLAAAQKDYLLRNGCKYKCVGSG